MSAGRWAAMGLSLALSADFARLAANQLAPNLEVVLGWLSGGFALAAVVSAVRGWRGRRAVAIAALSGVAIWAGLAVDAALVG